MQHVRPGVSPYFMGLVVVAVVMSFVWFIIGIAVGALFFT